MCAAAPLRFVFFILLIAACGTTSRAWAISSTPSWEPRELVADDLVNPNFANESQLAFDHHGNPGIAFFDDVNNELRYARRVPGIGWASGLVDDVSNPGSRPSLAFDRYERPAVAYYTLAGSDVRFALFDGSSWQSHLVYDGTTVLGQSLAFDLLGRPAIALAESTGLRFVQDTDGDFRFDDETPIPISNNFVGDVDLEFDSLNRPLISYSDVTDGGIHLAVRDPGVGWATGLIDSNGSPAAASLAINPTTGFPAVAYRRADGPWYAEWDGTAWNPLKVTSSAFVGGTSLAFDPADGNPAFAFQEGASLQDLRLAWFDGVTWQDQLVDSDAVGIVPSLAFNPYGSGFPSIAYMVDQGSFDDLYFIEDPPALVPEPASIASLAFGFAVFGICRRAQCA